MEKLEQERKLRFASDLNPVHELLYAKEYETVISQLQKEEPPALDHLLSLDACGYSPLLILCREATGDQIASLMPIFFKALVKNKRIHASFDGDTFFHMIIENKTIDIEGKISLFRLIEREYPKVFTAYCKASNKEDTIPLTAAFSVIRKNQDPSLLPLKLELISLLALNKTAAELVYERLNSLGIGAQKLTYFSFRQLSEVKKQVILKACRKFSLLPLKALFASGDYQLITALLQKKFFLTNQPIALEGGDRGDRRLIVKWFNLQLPFQTGFKTKVQTHHVEKLFISNIKDDLLTMVLAPQSLIEFRPPAEPKNEDQILQPEDQEEIAVDNQDPEPNAEINPNPENPEANGEIVADDVDQADKGIDPEDNEVNQDGDDGGDANQDGDGGDANPDQIAQDEPAQILDENPKIDDNDVEIVGDDDELPEGFNEEDPDEEEDHSWEDYYVTVFAKKCIEMALDSSDSIQEAFSRPLLKLLLNEFFPSAFQNKAFIEGFTNEMKTLFFTSKKNAEKFLSLYHALFKEMKTRMDAVAYAFFVCYCSIQDFSKDPLKHVIPHNSSTLNFFTDFAWQELPNLSDRDRNCIIYQWVSLLIGEKRFFGPKFSNEFKNAISLLISKNIDFSEKVPGASFIYDALLTKAMKLKNKDLVLMLLDKLKGKFQCVRSFSILNLQEADFEEDEEEGYNDDEEAYDEEAGYENSEEVVEDDENAGNDEEKEVREADDLLLYLSKFPKVDPSFPRFRPDSDRRFVIPSNEELVGVAMERNVMGTVIVKLDIDGNKNNFLSSEQVIEKFIEQRIHYKFIKSEVYQMRSGGRFLLPKLHEALKFPLDLQYLESKLDSCYEALSYSDLNWCLQKLRDSPIERADCLWTTMRKQLEKAFLTYTETDLISLIREYLLLVPEEPHKLLRRDQKPVNISLFEAITTRKLSNVLKEILRIIKDTSSDRNAYNKIIKECLSWKEFKPDGELYDTGSEYELNVLASALLTDSQFVTDLSTDASDYNIPKGSDPGFNPETFMAPVLKRFLVMYLRGDRTEKQIRVLLEDLFRNSKLFLNDDRTSVEELMIFNIVKSWKYPVDCYIKVEKQYDDDEAGGLYKDRELSKEQQEQVELANRYFARYEKVPLFFDLVLDGLGIAAEFGAYGRIQLGSNPIESIYREREISLLRSFLYETAKNINSFNRKASECRGYKEFVKRLNISIPKEADAMSFYILNIDVAMILEMFRSIETEGSWSEDRTPSSYSIEMVQADSKPSRMESSIEKGNVRILVQYQLVPSTHWKNCYLLEANTSNLNEIKRAILGIPQSPRMRNSH